MNSKNLLLLASMAVAITACKKDDDPAPTPAPPANNTATVKMAFTFMNGSNAFDMNAAYQDGAGNSFRFSGLKFYVSDIHLTDDGGATVGEFHDTYLLVDASAANDFTLGSINAAHIHEAHFALGLESAVNHADPLAAEYPLNVPDMHWSWNPTAGYKFLLIEGKVDGNGDGDLDDPEDVDVQYHCATDGMFRETHEHIHADADAGTTVTLQAKVDVGVLISGLDLLANPMAHGGGANNALAMDSLVTSISEM